MGLPWIRLDSQFASNPKILYLIEENKWRSIVVWAASLGYAGCHGTDGFIPKGALPLLHGTPKDARNLVEVGLWEDSLGGWQVNSWLEHQFTSQEVKDRKARAQKAAQQRWHPDNDGEEPC